MVWLLSGLAAGLLGLLAPAARAAPPLDHAGHWLTDPDGRVVVLHGTNMVYKLPPYDPQAAGFGDSDAAFLQSIGMTAVRVGVIWKAVEPAPGVYDDGYLDQIAATVQTLARHGIVSLLDFHQDMYNEVFQGEGAPDWAVLDDGLPNQPQAGFPTNYLVNPALQRTFENFLADKPGPGGVGLQERYAAAWAHVARRFAADPGVLGYEVMNEPFPGSDFGTCASPAGCPASDAELTGLSRKVAQAIRSVDARHLVFYEPYATFNNGFPDSVGPLQDPHAVFSWHDYCLSDEAAGCSSQPTTFANAAAHVAPDRRGLDAHRVRLDDQHDRSAGHGRAGRPLHGALDRVVLLLLSRPDRHRRRAGHGDRPGQAQDRGQPAAGESSTRWPSRIPT